VHERVVEHIPAHEQQEGNLPSSDMLSDDASYTVEPTAVLGANRYAVSSSNSTSPADRQVISIATVPVIIDSVEKGCHVRLDHETQCNRLKTHHNLLDLIHLLRHRLHTHMMSSCHAGMETRFEGVFGVNIIRQ
jgi:hypothetical protein